MPAYALDARSATGHFPGIGRYISSLVQAMLPLLATDERLVLLTDPAADSPWQLPPPTPQLIHLPAGSSPFSLRQQWLVPRLLRTVPAAVYHSPYYLMPYWPGVTTLLTVYDLIPRRFPHTVSRRARLLFHLSLSLAMRRAARLLCISRFTADDLARSYPGCAAKTQVVPLAAAPRFRPQSSSQLAQIRQRYRLPPRFLLYLGINKPHKNLPRLLQAYDGLRQALGQSAPPLIIAGAWDARYPETKVQAAAPALRDAVRFLGPVAEEDLPALYAAATLFVYPSLYEGFGLPVLEAMACGTAVACSHSSSLPEVGGQAAFYFDPYNVQEMAQVLARSLDDEALRQAHAQRGLAQAASFSWQRCAAETLAIYRQLAGRPAGSST